MASKEVAGDDRLKGLRDEIQNRTSLRLGDFTSSDDVFSYVDAILSSGSSEEARGSVYVLGGTESGKTSLCKTLRKYCKNDKKEPVPILEEKDQRTRVLDFVKEVQLRQKTTRTVKVSEDSKTIVEDVDTSSAAGDGEETAEPILTTFVDFAGHQEYVSCSSIFLKEKGIFLICFPKSKFTDSDESTFEKAFFPKIGTYLELALEKCVEPMFFLVATKADEARGSFDCQKILDKAKSHLKSIAGEKQPWIFDKVFETALKGQKGEDLQAKLDDLRDMLVSVFRGKELMAVKRMAVPRSWRNMMDRWKQPGQITKEIDEAVREFEDYDQETFKQGDSSGTVEHPEAWKAAVASLKDALENLSPTTPTEGPDRRQTLTVSGNRQRQQPQGTVSVESLDINIQREDENNQRAEHIPEGDYAEVDEGMATSRKNAERVLNFFASYSEILWFK